MYIGTYVFAYDMYIRTYVFMYAQFMCGSLVWVNILPFIVTAQEGPSIVIAHPGQNIELLCTVTPSGGQTAAWIINHVVYTVQQLHNDIVTGYSSNGNNLTIENIIMNDDRNNTQYICGIVPSTVSNPTLADIVDESEPIILYVAGEYQYMLHYIVIFNSKLPNITCMPKPSF